MALFQKIPQAGDNLPLYSIGASKNILIIGLGNPGKRYEDTRHNVGFMAIDFFAEQNDFPQWLNKKELKCHLTLKNLGDTRVILGKPTAYMNSSGEAVSKLQRFYRLYNNATLAVYDEMAIKFGQIRTRNGGSDAGHNGVKSLIQHIGEDFGRLRIGIGNNFSDNADASDFVLGKFTEEEKAKLLLILREANELINGFIVSGSISSDTRYPL